MPAINKTCSVFNAFNFKRDVHETLGHITQLKIGETEFTADLTLVEPIDEGAVSAVEVFDIVRAADVRESSMLAADGSDLEHDVAVGIAAQDDRIPLEHEELPGIEPS